MAGSMFSVVYQCFSQKLLCYRNCASKNPSVALATSFYIRCFSAHLIVMFLFIKRKDFVVIAVGILSSRVGQQPWFSTEHVEIKDSASCSNAPEIVIKTAKM